MSELNPDSRMQARGRGDLMHPGCCAVCGNGNYEGKYIDTGIWYEYEGRVYFCMACVNELADTAGLLTDTEARYLCVQNKDLAEKNAKITHDLKVANERLHHYDSLFNDTFSALTDNIDPDNNDEQSGEESDGGPVSESSDNREEEQPAVVKPTTGEGYADTSGTEQPDSGFSI